MKPHKTTTMEMQYPFDPTNDETKICPNCGGTLFKHNEEWIHWNEDDCQEEEEIFIDPGGFDLFGTCGDMFNPFNK